MIGYKVSYSVYDDQEKRFVRRTDYYYQWYIDIYKIDLKTKYSKEVYHNPEIETFVHPKENAWISLNRAWYKVLPMLKEF